MNNKNMMKTGSRRKQLEALAAITILFVLIARWERSWYTVYVAAMVLVMGVLWRGFAEILRRYWMMLGKGLGVISGTILLTLVYILAVLPLSYFARRSGKFSIRLKPGGGSNFRDRAYRYAEKDFLHPW
jgi:hypothetical protein